MGLQISADKDPPSDIKMILPVLLFKLRFNIPGPIIYVRTQMEICSEKLYRLYAWTIDFNKRIYIFSSQAKE